jgi:hypothetical protein
VWGLVDRRRQPNYSAPRAGSQSREAPAWQQRRWPEARAAARRAEGLLTGGGGGPGLRQRAGALLADQAMIERLEEIRLQQSAVKDSHFDIAGADAAYAQAFRDYGMDVEALGPAASRRSGSAGGMGGNPHPDPAQFSNFHHLVDFVRPVPRGVLVSAR